MTASCDLSAICCGSLACVRLFVVSREPKDCLPSLFVSYLNRIWHQISLPQSQAEQTSLVSNDTPLTMLLF